MSFFALTSASSLFWCVTSLRFWHLYTIVSLLYALTHVGWRTFNHTQLTQSYSLSLMCPLSQPQILRSDRIRSLSSIGNQIERTFSINLRAIGWKLVLFALNVSWASLLSTLFTSLKTGRQNFMRPLSGLIIQLAATGAKSEAAGLERANSYQRSPISALFVVVKPYISDMWWMWVAGRGGTSDNFSRKTTLS